MAKSPVTIYNQITVVRRHSRDEGLLAMARSGYGYPGSASSVNSQAVLIRKRVPIEYLHIDWECVREGAPPEVPHWSLFDTNAVFLHGERGAAVPLPSGTNLQVWQIKGTYTYVLRSPQGLDSAMPTGKVPFEQGPASANTIPASTFKVGILDDTVPLVNPL